MHVVGTAGHIDHGKSTLVKMLTGTDPDRLKEEKERGMTIDLGFAHLELPSGRSAGVVDVPGHHRFVKNMLAGVGGVDLVLFVVAATEGWMPQSQEHLEIVDLLGIDRGLVVMTKVDLVEEEWADMVEEEVRERLAGTVLDGAKIVRVSSVTGQGIDEMKKLIDDMLADESASPGGRDAFPAEYPRGEPRDFGKPRLWIDRVFTIKGAGTVVTGTLHGGAIQLEDELDVLPSGRRVRVRGLQAHNRQLERAEVGGRVAVNLAGIYVDEVERGDLLCAPNALTPSTVFHASLRTVPSLKRHLETMALLKLYVGTAERMARVKLLDKEAVGPSEEALIQVEVDRPVAVQWQDRFVLRDPALQVTVGGGRVLVAPARRVRGTDHRYLRSEQSDRHRILVGPHVPERLNLDSLRALMTRDVRAWLETLLVEEGWIDRRRLASIAPTTAENLEAAVNDLVERAKAVRLRSFLVSAAAWAGLTERAMEFVATYHASYPLRTGVPRETLRSHLGLDWRLFDEMLEAMEGDGRLVSSGARVRLTGHEVVFSPAQQAEVDRILDALRAAPFTPPGAEEILNGVEGGEELLGALAERGDVVRISKALVFDREAFETIRRRVVEHIEAHGAIEVAHLRDLLQTTRKYAVPLLEYLDQIEVTRRVADTRVLGPKAHAQL